MKKKFLALVFTCLFLSGCSNFQKKRTTNKSRELRTKERRIGRQSKKTGRNSKGI